MNRIITFLAMAAVSGAALASGPAFQSAPSPLYASTNPQFQYVQQFAGYKIDLAELRAQLDAAPMEDPMAVHQGNEILLPGPDGELHRFRIVNSPIQTPRMERQSGVHTYLAQGIDDPWATGRFDIGMNGFHGFVRSPQGDYMIEPARLGDQVNSVVFYRHDNFAPRNWACFTKGTTVSAQRAFGGGALRPGSNRKDYRLAIKGTVEYTAFYGGVAAATNGAITSCNRVSGVYEVDHAIRLIIVNNVMYGSEPDPYTNNNGGTMLGQNQTTCDAAPGNANYDIGHVFSTGGGGIAGLQVVGVTGNKARGVTGSGSPIGDGFDIDYVAHEMGHQFGANHTFNGTTGSCGGGNRSAAHAYEPGSGTTIMAYAGICGAEDLQPHSDAYQHTDSQSAIEAWRNNAGSGGTTTNTGNNAPVVTVGSLVTIPSDTPFKLSATATDADGDPLTYCWEQFDLGTAGPAINEATSPLFRSLNPTTSGTRFFPKQTTVLNNVTDTWENLPSLARTMNFRCTVRDNRAGGGNYEWGLKQVTVVVGAFTVTSPNTAVTLTGGSSQTVTWNVGGSTGTPNVRILLSTDGGASYYNNTATVLLASTANDGSEVVTLPNITTTTARIFVEGVTNPFYDCSNVNFTINAASLPPTITSLSPNNTNAGGAAFTLTVNGTNYTGTSTVRWNGANRATTFVNSTQLTATIPATDIAASGSANVTVITPAVGTSNTAVFTINSVTQTVNPGTVTVVAGTQFGGTLASLATSDNNRFVVLCDENDPNGTVVVTGTSPYTNVTKVQLIFETAASRTDLSQFMDMFNYQTNSYEQVDFRSTTLSDTGATLTFTSNAARFVQSGGGAMQARVRWIPQADIDAGDGWTQSIDRLVWTASN